MTPPFRNPGSRLTIGDAPAVTSIPMNLTFGPGQLVRFERRFRGVRYDEFFKVIGLSAKYHGRQVELLRAGSRSLEVMGIAEFNRRARYAGPQFTTAPIDIAVTRFAISDHVPTRGRRT